MSTRVAELRSLVDEHTRLDAAPQALGDIDSHARVPRPAAPAAQSRSRAPSKTSPAVTRKRASRGANRLAVLRAAENRPGATSAEIGTVSGVQGGTLHTLLVRLVESGELQRKTLPTGRTGYALSQTELGASAGSAPAAGDAA